MMPDNHPALGNLSEELLLAAIERAQRHESHGGRRAVLLSTIAAHLALPWGSGTARRLHPKLDALEAAGLLLRSRQLGATVWKVTSNGRLWLGIVRLAGEIGALPESPQHEEWRKARAAATERIDQLKDDLSKALEDAQHALGSAGADSTEWFAIGERLRKMTRWVGSATYCLREWEEPDDSKADLDPPNEHGRRGFRQWSRR